MLHFSYKKDNTFFCLNFIRWQSTNKIVSKNDIFFKDTDIIKKIIPHAK